MLVTDADNISITTTNKLLGRYRLPPKCQRLRIILNELCHLIRRPAAAVARLGGNEVNEAGMSDNTAIDFTLGPRVTLNDGSDGPNARCWRRSRAR